MSTALRALLSAVLLSAVLLAPLPAGTPPDSSAFIRIIPLGHRPEEQAVCNTGAIVVHDD